MSRLVWISVLLSLVTVSIGVKAAMSETFSVYPVGKVVRTSQQTAIEIFPDFRDALLGLHGFSHIIVLYWFDKNDSPEKRAILRVHPRKDPKNPLTGVFGTRSPVRPNLIAFSVCKIKTVDKGSIIIQEIDAFDQTPVLDIKPYLPHSDLIPDATVPKWVGHKRGD